MVCSTTSAQKQGFALTFILLAMALISGAVSYWLRQEILFSEQAKANLKHRKTMTQVHLAKARVLATLKNYTKSNVQQRLTSDKFDQNIPEHWKAETSYSSKNQQLGLTLSYQNTTKFEFLFKIEEGYLSDIPFVYLPQSSQKTSDVLDLQSAVNVPLKYPLKYNNRDLSFDYSSAAKSHLTLSKTQLTITKRGPDPIFDLATTNTFRFEKETTGSGSFSHQFSKPVYLRVDGDLTWTLPNETSAFASQHSNLFVRVKGNLYFKSQGSSSNVVGAFLVEGEKCVSRENVLLKISWTGSLACLGKNIVTHGSSIQLKHVQAPQIATTNFAFKRQYLIPQQGAKWDLN